MRAISRYILLIITVMVAMPMRAQINTDQVLRIGQNALYFDDYMLSIQYFNQVAQVKPYLAQPYFFRAIAKLNLEDYQGAEADATAAIERNPFITDAYEVRGVARQNLGKHAEAIADYDKALTQLPDNRGILYNKALAQEEVKDYDGARESYDRLLKVHPRFDNGYVGRAKLSLATGDTVAAKNDLDQAISLNKNIANAYILRAEIAIKSARDYPGALADMDAAVRLQPHNAGLYINRAFLRYNLDDYFGAMADYDYAISLDPFNPVAVFNRGLMRMEVHDNDRAIADFTKALQLDPDDYRALYNRAMLYSEAGNYRSALADIDRVVAAFPDFSGVRFTRFSIYDKMGDKRNAERDYNAAMELSRKELAEAKAASGSASSANATPGDMNPAADSQGDEPANDEPADLVAKRFSTLLTINNDISLHEEYNNKNIRGKVQDRNMTIELEPLFRLSYYTSPTQLRETNYFIKEVDDVNSTRSLRFVLMLTSDDTGPSTEEEIERHFQSIEYYNSYIATHNPRAIDYFGRAMDFMMLHNYASAISDFTRATELTPDFSLGYLMRAVARYKNLKAETGAMVSSDNSGHPDDWRIANSRNAETLSMILADLDHVISLSPRIAFAYYNKGNILAESNDYQGALDAYNRAIELKPDFGEAYYNRGYVYMQIGNRAAGTSDLSKAGELGIIPSYNLLKRMNR